MNEIREFFEERARPEACRPDPDDPVHNPVWSDIARDDRGVYATVIAARPVTVSEGQGYSGARLDGLRPPVTLNPGDVFRIPVAVGAHGRHEHPYRRFVYRYADGTRIAAVIWRVPE